VLLTDLDDANIAAALARAVRLLAPPHLVLVAGVHSGEIEELARAGAREWQDPWIALAAAEHEERANRQRLLLQRLGAPVVAASAQRLESILFEHYEALRRSRRI
jgi:predicted NBD/HSP70 family sugar kinase